MPKKTVRTSRVKSRVTTREVPPVHLPMPFEKIDLEVAREEKKIENQVQKAVRGVKKLLSDHSSLTKAEFLKFFVIPFLVSSIFLFFILLHFATNDSIRVPSVKVKTSLHSVADIVSVAGKLLSRQASFQGQDVFDPYQVKLDIDKGKMFYALLDVRSPEEFRKGHIRDAVNLPTYRHFTDLKNLNLSEREIMELLHKTISHKKPLVIYGSTRDSQLTHDVAAILSRNGYEVSTLGVGWNEWRHFINLWVPEANWDSFRIEQYVDEK